MGRSTAGLPVIPELFASGTRAVNLINIKKIINVKNKVSGTKEHQQEGILLMQKKMDKKKKKKTKSCKRS